MKQNRARMNYWVDVTIGVGFLASAISGLVFLIPFEWLPFQADGVVRILGLAYGLWSGLHTWSSLVMIAGVMVHLVMHWNWMIKMTHSVFSKPTTRLVENAMDSAQRGGIQSTKYS